MKHVICFMMNSMCHVSISNWAGYHIKWHVENSKAKKKHVWQWLIVVVTLTLGSWPKLGLAKVRAKREARESHLMFSGVRKSVREWTFTLPRSSQFGSWNLGGFPNFQRAIVRVNTRWIEEFFISLKSYWNVDV
jgi:hypothetical protein